MMNPLRAWFEHRPRQMLQKDFAKQARISQSFLTSLLSDTPPWPSRAVMRKITELTKGAVTANHWVELEDPPPRGHGRLVTDATDDADEEEAA
jgi:hypothetical protein